MDSDSDVSTSERYLVTAVHIFDLCNADSHGTLSAEALMEKIAPYLKTNKSESDLRSLLDPEQINPEISVTTLSNALSKYSETQKNMTDFDDSFNMKSGPVPQDSDSGISSDGFQLLEELQHELREKDRVSSQLRNELAMTEQTHEEALSAIAAERDALRAHLNILREENSSLVRMREEYEEVSERLSNTEAKLEEAQRALEVAKRRALNAQKCRGDLEADKQTLQELLSKSKEECHRINDMYASRQSALLERNEALSTECAEMAARLQDQEEAMQILIKEKIRIEMELKEQLNRSSLHSMRADHSIDVSYTEEQLLSALDGLNSGSRFSQDNTLDDLSFFTFPEDPGRPTNMSLFDEIKLSFGNLSKFKDFDNSRNSNVHTQCDDAIPRDFVDFASKKSEKECAVKLFGLEREKYKVDFGTQTSVFVDEVTQSKEVEKQCANCEFLRKNKRIQCNISKPGICNVGTQCETKDFGFRSINTQCSSADFGLQNVETQCGPKKLRLHNIHTQCEPNDFGLKDIETQCRPKDFGFQNIETQCGPKDFGLKEIETQCEIKDFRFHNMKSRFGPKNLEILNIETQIGPNDSGLKNIQTRSEPKDLELRINDTKTNCDNKVETNNNNLEAECNDCIKCVECDKMKEQAKKLEREITRSQKVINDLKYNISSYEGNLKLVKALSDEEKQANKVLKSSIKGLKSKLEVLERACVEQKSRLERFHCDKATAECQTLADVSSVATQAEIPCLQCESRVAVPKRTWKQRVCYGVTSLFSFLALLCFSGALCFLYQVTQYHFASKRCGGRPALPWSWLRVGDMLDAVFRVEYVGEVPM